MSAGLNKIDPRTSIKTAEEMLKIVKAFGRNAKGQILFELGLASKQKTDAFCLGQRLCLYNM